MKKLTFLSVFAVLFTALSFMSCNTESEAYVAPTATEATAMFSAIGSRHNGKLIYYSDNKANINDYTDTISVYCDVRSSDSIATIHDVPTSIFAKYITDEALSKAVAEVGEADIKVNIIPYLYSGMSFIANPYDVTIENVNYNGGTHTVAFKFWANTNIAGLATSSNTSSSKSYFVINMTIAYVYLDGKATSYLGYVLNNTNVTYPLFVFYAEK